MKIGEPSYIVLTNISGSITTNLEYAVGLRIFHIKKLGTIYAEGFFFERFGNIPNGGAGHNIITKKKKKRGIEIDFEPYESVAIGMRLPISELRSFEQAKLELIKFISNDFSDPDDINHQDEDY